MLGDFFTAGFVTKVVFLLRGRGALTQIGGWRERKISETRFYAKSIVTGVGFAIMRYMRTAAFLLCASVLLDRSFGSDWPQLLGPTRDAVYSGPALAEKWSAKNAIVWQKDV